MGESGTGKGVTAREIHEGSVRSEGSFIQVNCGGLSEGLVDSELFGHEEGHSPVQFDLGQERSNWLTGGLSSYTKWAISLLNVRHVYSMCFKMDL